MDDQSTLSYVYPNVTDELDIEMSDQVPTTQTTRTIQGIGSNQCLSIKGLLITPLTGEASIPLTNALTHELPSLLQDIPTPEEVSSIPGLSHLAPKFPKKQDWPTILLLGRDCMKAQTQGQYTWSKDEQQLATNTPLGWAIMGRPAKSTCPLSRKPCNQPSNVRSFTLLQQPPPPQPNHPRARAGKSGKFPGNQTEISR